MTLATTRNPESVLPLTRRAFNIGLAGTTLAAALATPLRAAAPPRMVDVIVLGAGMSGLNTAWLLEQQGLRMMVLEARQRVGGRILTLFDQPGYPEMGFNSMGDGYGRGIDAARRAGVELVDVAPRYRTGPPQGLFLGGKPLTRDEWARSPLNPFPDRHKAVMPWELVGTLVGQHNPLVDWLEWTDPRHAALDIPLHDFLAAQGLSDPAIRLAFDTSPYHGTNSYDVSAMMLEYNDGWVRSQMAAGPRSLAVKGGNQKLPAAMAKLLKGDVLLGKEVAALNDDGSTVTVACTDGSTYRTGRVVCSLPFTTLRNVTINPGLTGAQARAVATIAYQQIATIFLTVDAPFWEQDGLAPGMWTDSLIGTALPQRFGATDAEISGLSLQARGRLARYWDAIGHDVALARAVAAFETLRPAAKGKVKGASIQSWGAEPFSGGAWAYFGPGQATGLAAEMAKPAGRVHFCGEHTAVASRGVEGALESSERVALEILSL